MRRRNSGAAYALPFERICSYVGSHPHASLAEGCRALQRERHYIEACCRAHDTSFRRLRTHVTAELAALRILGGESVKAVRIGIGIRTDAGMTRLIRREFGLTPHELTTTAQRIGATRDSTSSTTDKLRLLEAKVLTMKIGPFE